MNSLMNDTVLKARYDIIVQALRQYKTRRAAAQYLGLTSAGFYRWLKVLNIDPADYGHKPWNKKPKGVE